MATRRRKSRAQTFGKESFSITLYSDVEESLAALEQGVKDKVLRSAAHAGALVFYNEMRARVPVHDGTLHDSIYRYHDDRGSTPTQHNYFIGPNKLKAGHWHHVEFGHWRRNVLIRLPDGTFKATRERLDPPKWVPPEPYVRPTWEGKKSEAVQAMRLRASQRLQELMRELQ